MFRIRQFIIRGTFDAMKQKSCREMYTAETSMIRIKVGGEIPSAILYEESPENKVNLRLLGVLKTMVLFGVPGAFSPSCSKIHLPGYINRAIEMKEAGVDVIVCVSVNDPYVMAAWANRHNTRGKIRMLADPSGRFIRALGLGMNHSTLGGYRSKRFSMLIKNNRVEVLNVEPDNTGLSCTLANELDYKTKDTV